MSRTTQLIVGGLFAFFFLISLIVAFLIGNSKDKSHLATMEEDNFTMHIARSSIAFLIFAASAFLVFLLMPFIAGEFKQETMLAIFSYGLLFGLPSVVLLLMIIRGLRWKIEVTDDRMTIFPAFGEIHTILFNEISFVRVIGSKISFFLEDSAVFSLSNIRGYGILGIDKFISRMHELGKMEATQVVERKETIIIKPSKGIKIILGIAVSIYLIFFLAIFIWISISPNETVTTFVYAGFFLMLLLSLFVFLDNMLLIFRWKISVTQDELIIRPKYTKEKHFLIKDISKVKVSQNNLIIFCGKRKIATIGSSFTGVFELAERLDKNNIMSS